MAAIMASSVAASSCWRIPTSLLKTLSGWSLPHPTPPVVLAFVGCFSWHICPDYISVFMSSQQKLHMDNEALLEQPANQPELAENHDGRWPSLLTVIGFMFLTFNSFMAVYRSNGDLKAISFVIFSYLDLVVLFYSLRQFEKAPPDSPRREHIKMVVWLLTTMLTAAFSYKVAEIMPLPVQVLVWSMAGVTVLGGFYAFFLHQEGTKA